MDYSQIVRINSKIPNQLIKLVEKPWEAQILKRNVFALSFYKKNNFEPCFKPLDTYQKILKLIEKELEEYKPYILMTRISTLDINEKKSLEINHFKLIECYIELEHYLNKIYPSTGKNIIRPFRKEEISKLQEIAYSSFQFSRFHMDSDISKADANLTRSEWIKNACLGRAEFVLVSEINSQPTGFIICLKKKSSKEPIGQLDLIAVDNKYRKLKIGYDLTIEFLKCCKEKKFNLVRVGTQAHNVPSLRLYEKTGFLIYKSSYSYHKHV